MSGSGPAAARPVTGPGIIRLDNVRGFDLFADVPEGSELAQAPEWSYNLLVSYEWNLPRDLVLRVQADYAWTDEQAAALSDPAAIYGPYSALGARLSLTSADEKWELALWGKNLTDEDSETYSFTNFFGGRVIYRQQPASFGATLSYNFF